NGSYSYMKEQSNSTTNQCGITINNLRTNHKGVWTCRVLALGYNMTASKTLTIYECPDDSLLLNSECFLVVTGTKRSWTDARTSCAELGGDLAQPNDIAALRSYIKDRGIGGDFWIGGSDTENDNTWKWLNGTVITEGWAAGRPGDSDCLDFRTGNVPYGCGNKQKYICER
ncbi:unnamed protein product, partial [Meganyctiphanes norvegica]